MRHYRLMPFVIAGAALCAAVACKQDSSTDVPAEAAREPSFSAVGPQPGQDKPLPKVVNPYANNRDVLAEGRRLFNWYNCSGCHGDHAGGGMGPSLRDSSWRYGNRDDQIFQSISEGRQFGMPAWGPKLNRDQIWKIVTYIKSLRTPDEPDAPTPTK